MNDLLLAKSIEVDLEYYESARIYDRFIVPREAPTRPISIVNGWLRSAKRSSLLAIADCFVV